MEKSIGDRFDNIRRRWLNVAGIYVLLLMFSILFAGPFVFGIISSIKDNPTEWPPSISAEQFTFSNWAGLYSLSTQAGGGGFFGNFRSGKSVTFRATYLYPENIAIEKPEVVIPHKEGSTIKEKMNEIYASDYIQVYSIEEVKREKLKQGIKVGYSIEIINSGDRAIPTVPLQITVPPKVEFIKATYTPNSIERRGRTQSWYNISGGIIPYIFYNYNRVFNENYDPATGKLMFLGWIINSFVYAFVKILTNVLFASMAGYALARLKFRGKTLIFFLTLFSMMIPLQVTFISNYIVLRDGIFGFTKLFGVDTLLNTYTGLVTSGLVASASVFVMKQFFESLSPSLEESAKIDGANTFTIFFKIMMPLAKPAVGAITILTFQAAWNDFFLPLVYITYPQSKYPLTIGLLSLQKKYAAGGFDWGLILAGSMISAIPVLIVFFVFQKYFIAGVSFGGSKE